MANRGDYRFVPDESELACFIEILDIGRRRSDLVTESQNGNPCFEASSSAKEVSGHGFRGAHQKLFCVIAEGGGNGGSFGTVAKGGGGGVSVEVLDIRGSKSGIFKSELHNRRTPEPSSGGAFVWKASELAA